jgi:hypothetical protein
VPGPNAQPPQGGTVRAPSFYAPDEKENDVALRTITVIPRSPLTGFPLAVYTQVVDLPDHDILSVVDEPTAPLPTVVATVIRTPSIRARLRRSLTDGASSILQTARDAAAWVTAELPVAARAFELWDRARQYRGRHHVQRRWYGRTRSSAEVTGVLHRRYAEARTLTIPEDDVPRLHAAESLYWVGWAERMAEVARASDEALHPTTEHRFVCS